MAYARSAERTTRSRAAAPRAARGPLTWSTTTRLLHCKPTEWLVSVCGDSNASSVIASGSFVTCCGLVSPRAIGASLIRRGDSGPAMKEDLDEQHPRKPVRRPAADGRRATRRSDVKDPHEHHWFKEPTKEVGPKYVAGAGLRPAGLLHRAAGSGDHRHRGEGADDRPRRAEDVGHGSGLQRRRAVRGDRQRAVRSAVRPHHRPAGGGVARGSSPARSS